MLRFVFVTTFYPPHHFGGDAVLVRHMAEALVRAGHRVDVIYDVDAYRALDRGAPRPRHRPTRAAFASTRCAAARLPLAAPHSPARPAGGSPPHDRAAAGRRRRRRALPQRVAGRRARHPRLRRRAQALHRARALAGLPHPRPLAARSRALRRAPVPALSRALPPAAAALALERPARAQRAARRRVLFPQPLLDRQAPRVRVRAADDPAAAVSTRGARADDPARRGDTAGSDDRPPMFLFVGRLERIKGLDDVIPLFAGAEEPRSSGSRAKGRTNASCAASPRERHACASSAGSSPSACAGCCAKRGRWWCRRQDSRCSRWSCSRPFARARR